MPVLSSRECERHYWSTLETPSTTTGTRYLCTEEELYELLHAHEMADRFRNKRDKFVSLGKATWDLEHFLQRHPSDRQRAALKRLRAAARDPTWTTDVFIKAFHDLDLVFFDSTMKGRVRLLWKGSDEGLTTSLGNQHYKMLGCTRIMLQHPVIIVEIVLNAQSLFFGMLPTCDIRAQIWRTLLHEMVVSAFLVLSFSIPML